MMLLISCALTRSLSSSLLLLLLLLLFTVVVVVIHSCLLLLLSCCMWAAFVVEMPLINEFWLFCWNDVGKCALIYIQTNTHTHAHIHSVSHTLTLEFDQSCKQTQSTHRKHSKALERVGILRLSGPTSVDDAGQINSRLEIRFDDSSNRSNQAFNLKWIWQ